MARKRATERFQQTLRRRRLAPLPSIARTRAREATRRLHFSLGVTTSALVALMLLVFLILVKAVFSREIILPSQAISAIMEELRVIEVGESASEPTTHGMVDWEAISDLKNRAMHWDEFKDLKEPFSLHLINLVEEIFDASRFAFPSMEMGEVTPESFGLPTNQTKFVQMDLLYSKGDGDKARIAVQEALATEMVLVTRLLAECIKPRNKLPVSSPYVCLRVFKNELPDGEEENLVLPRLLGELGQKDPARFIDYPILQAIAPLLRSIISLQTHCLLGRAHNSPLDEMDASLRDARRQFVLEGNVYSSPDEKCYAIHLQLHAPSRMKLYERSRFNKHIKLMGEKRTADKEFVSRIEQSARTLLKRFVEGSLPAPPTFKQIDDEMEAGAAEYSKLLEEKVSPATIVESTETKA